MYMYLYVQHIYIYIQHIYIYLHRISWIVIVVAGN